MGLPVSAGRTRRRGPQRSAAPRRRAVRPVDRSPSCGVVGRRWPRCRLPSAALGERSWSAVGRWSIVLVVEVDSLWSSVGRSVVVVGVVARARRRPAIAPPWLSVVVGDVLLGGRAVAETDVAVPCTFACRCRCYVRPLPNGMPCCRRRCRVTVSAAGCPSPNTVVHAVATGPAAGEGRRCCVGCWRLLPALMTAVAAASGWRCRRCRGVGPVAGGAGHVCVVAGVADAAVVGGHGLFEVEVAIDVESSPTSKSRVVSVVEVVDDRVVLVGLTYVICCTCWTTVVHGVRRRVLLALRRSAPLYCAGRTPG